MDVSIAICTWNRADLLDRTLASLGGLRIPDGLEWELLVVDNGCTDHTAEVLRRHAERLPLRALVEPAPGHTHARNCAVAAARGALLVWTDDDVRVDPGWVEAYVAAARDRPEASAWGGVVAPDFEVDPPDWLRDAWTVVASVYATRDLGGSAFEIVERATFPYGANWALRTAVQKAYPFDTRLGVRRGARVAGDETDVLERMRADGHRVWWVPASRVEHWVPGERMTLDYIGHYWHGIGEASAIQHDVSSPARLFGKAMAREVRYRMERLAAPSRVWLRSFVRARYHRGRYATSRGGTAAPSDQAR